MPHCHNLCHTSPLVATNCHKIATSLYAINSLSISVATIATNATWFLSRVCDVGENSVTFSAHSPIDTKKPPEEPRSPRGCYRYDLNKKLIPTIRAKTACHWPSAQHLSWPWDPWSVPAHHQSLYQGRCHTCLTPWYSQNRVAYPYNISFDGL